MSCDLFVTLYLTLATSPLSLIFPLHELVRGGEKLRTNLGSMLLHLRKNKRDACLEEGTSPGETIVRSILSRVSNVSSL